APVAPTGWPSAIAPPLGLTRAMSGFTSRSQASTTDANASLISIVSKSSIPSPVRSIMRRVASIGPVSIRAGSTPTRHWSTTRALETAFGPRLLRALLREQAELITVGARDTPLVRDALRALELARRLVALPIRRRVRTAELVAHRGPERHPAHRLDTACERDVD